MTLEDALLLEEQPERLDVNQELAQDRYMQHIDLEQQRRAAGIDTDLQRYVDGREFRD